MADDELQEELRPGLGVELLGEVGHRAVADALEEPRAAERRVGEDAHLALLRQRQDGGLGVAVVDGVVDADEVERLLAHRRDQVGVLAFEGGGEADVADPSLLLELPQDRDLHADVAHVVHLDEVDLRLPDARERRLDLRPRRRRIGAAAAAAGDVQLGRPEDLVGEPQLVDDLPGRLFRGAVAGRRVEHRGAAVDQRLEHLAQGRQVFAAGHRREGRRAAQADDRQSARRSTGWPW